MKQDKVKSSGCCSCSHDDKTQHGYENHNHDHNHNHGDGDFELKRELIPVLLVIVLFVFGFAFEETLHNTPYAIAEYLVFIPAYLLSGWNILTIAGRNILRGRFLMKTF